MKTQTAKLNYLKISPRKARLVADLIKGLPVNEAEAQLLILPNRASKPLLKLLRSAMANARNNQQMDVNKLLVKDIRVDIGPRQKRWRTRARGSSSPIAKQSCHISLVLEESEKEIPLKFKFVPKPKKSKKEKTAKEKIHKHEHEHPAVPTSRQEKPEKAHGHEEKHHGAKPKRFEAFKKFFRRKTI
jgi:large subunit ribosomal protein L22